MNRDGTSQLSLIIFIENKMQSCHFVHCSSSKCTQVTCSMLASKTYAIFMGYNYGVSLKLLFKDMSMDAKLIIFTDC